MSEPGARSGRSILAGYASVLGGDLGRLLVFAAFIPLLVRTVGPDGFGLYAFVMALFIPLRRLLNFGLFDATKTYVARSDADSAAVITTSFWLHAGLLVAGLGLAALAIASLPIEADLADSLLLALLAILGNQLYLFGRGVCHALEREALVEPLIPARSVVLAVVGLALAGAGYGVPGVFAGFATGFLLTGLVSAGAALRVSGVVPVPRRRALRAYAPTLLRFGGPTMVLLLLTVGLYKIDVLLVSYFESRTATGQYRAALQVAEFIWVVAVGMELVMIQTTADLWSRERIERISDLLARVVRYVAVLLVLLIVGVFVLGDAFISLYFGPGYDASVRPLRLLLPGVLGFGVARVVWPVLQAGGYLRAVVAATGLATGTNLALNLVLIPTLGIDGAAIATSISYGSMALLHLAAARRASLRPLAGFPVARVVGTGAVTLGALLALEPRLSPALSLVVLPPLGLLVYAAGILGSGAVTVSEVREVLGLPG